MKDDGHEEGMFKAEGTAWPGYGEQLCAAEAQMEHKESEKKIRKIRSHGKRIKSRQLQGKPSKNRADL